MTHAEEIAMRAAAMFLLIATLAGCAAETGPAGQPSSTNVNPQSGSVGGHGGH